MEDTVKAERARYWLKQDQWTLFEGICLLEYGGFAEGDHNQEEIDSTTLYATPLFQSALRSIRTGKLEVLSKLPDDKLYDSVLNPLAFLKWAAEKEALPPYVIEVLSAEQQAALEAISTSELKNVNQRHRERCRAVAECIWMREPHLTIEDMIHHDDINGIACENRTYAAKTLREWLKDLCPNRQPGRRPAKPTT